MLQQSKILSILLTLSMTKPNCMATNKKPDKRAWEISDSNNPKNPRKNLCVLAVARHLKVNSKAVRYLHYATDLVVAARAKYYCSTRRLLVPKNSTVGQLRPLLSFWTSKEKLNVLGYIVRLHGHVIFLSPEGKTVVDTDPRVRDARRVKNCDVWVVLEKLVTLPSLSRIEY